MVRVHIVQASPMSIYPMNVIVSFVAHPLMEAAHTVPLIHTVMVMVETSAFGAGQERWAVAHIVRTDNTKNKAKTDMFSRMTRFKSRSQNDFCYERRIPNAIYC